MYEAIKNHFYLSTQWFVIANMGPNKLSEIVRVATILGRVAKWIQPSPDDLGSLFEPHSFYKYGFFTLMSCTSWELGTPLTREFEEKGRV